MANSRSFYITGKITEESFGRGELAFLGLAKKEQSDDADLGVVPLTFAPMESTTLPRLLLPNTRVFSDMVPWLRFIAYMVSPQ